MLDKVGKLDIVLILLTLIRSCLLKTLVRLITQQIFVEHLLGGISYSKRCSMYRAEFRSLASGSPQSRGAHPKMNSDSDFKQLTYTNYYIYNR